MTETLDRAEWTLYSQLLDASLFGAVINEAIPEECARIDLPPPVRGAIVPAEVHERRCHSDLRIARRARTIARLAQVISEREVTPGFRHTLLVQARRLEWLAARRHHDSRE